MESFGGANPRGPGIASKRYTSALKQCSKCTKHPPRVTYQEKHTKKHWLEQSLVTAKNISAISRNAYKTCHIIIVLEAQIRVVPD